MTGTPEFVGKVALVTGAASGIGAATAQAFADAGASVVLCDTNPKVETKALKMAETGLLTTAVIGDTSDANDCAAMVERALSQFGRLDFSFNNAGIGSRMRPIDQVDEDSWQRMLSINLTGVFLCMREQIPAMIASGGGVIVNNSSVLGMRAIPETSLEYTAAKHGVIGLTRQAALNHAQDNIRCVAVCPGFIETPLTTPGTSIDIDEEARRWFVERTPLGRPGQPEDIADTVIMLCSERSRFVTGVSLLVDGGFSGA